MLFRVAGWRLQIVDSVGASPGASLSGGSTGPDLFTQNYWLSQWPWLEVTCGCRASPGSDGLLQASFKLRPLQMAKGRSGNRAALLPEFDSRFCDPTAFLHDISCPTVVIPVNQRDPLPAPTMCPLKDGFPLSRERRGLQGIRQVSRRTFLAPQNNCLHNRESSKIHTSHPTL